VSKLDARTLIAQGVIAGSACAGAYALLVQPLERELAKARETLAARQAEANEMEAARESLPQLLRRLDSAEARAKQIASASVGARDDAAVFSRVMALGDELGVRVDNLEPRAVDRRRRQADEGARAGEGEARFTMAVSGKFSDLLRFLDALPARVGFTRVDGLSVSPHHGAGEGAVIAMIETSHLAFDATPIEMAAVEDETGEE